MTVFLRALWGPFGPFLEGEIYTYGGTLAQAATHVDWHFFGIREDNTMGRWTVRFTVNGRTFKTVNLPANSRVRAGKSWLELPKEVVHPDAFVPDRPMLRGATYLHILKPRLRNEDIALATRLAIEAAR